MSLTTGPVLSALQQAKAAVEEGMTLLKDRQKAIRLADRSELGWAVVNEYGEDELAEDSEDEKRIAKAVATAEKKVAQLKKKKSGHGGYMQSRLADVPSRGPRQVESGQQGARISRNGWTVLLMWGDGAPETKLSKESTAQTVSFV